MKTVPLYTLPTGSCFTCAGMKGKLIRLTGGAAIVDLEGMTTGETGKRKAGRTTISQGTEVTPTRRRKAK